MKEIISQAVKILREGGLVGIPTETVYGLAADAKNPDAIKKIFHAKQRPTDHPLIVHIGDISQLPEWAIDISEDAKLLAKTFWPGPLTLILKKSPTVSDLITGQQDTIGLRIPNHPLTLSLLNAFGSGLAAPSANRFGRISPTTAQAVKEELGDNVDLVLEGGVCEVGVESTIIDVTQETPVILRPGMITKEQIEQVLKKPILKKQQSSPRVSGSHELHYAPQTKTSLIKDIKQFIDQLTMEDVSIALMLRTKIQIDNKNILIIQMPKNAKDYAHDLYQTLRELDNKNFNQIVIEDVPETSEWNAIRDRLVRASH